MLCICSKHAQIFESTANLGIIATVVLHVCVQYLPWFHAIEEAAKLLILHISDGARMRRIFDNFILQAEIN